MADKNWISYADRDGFSETLDVVKAPDETYNDVLKFSHATNFEVRGSKLFGGTEDCADFNRFCSNGKVNFDEWYSGGKYVVTIKGESDGIEVGGTIMKHGSEVDVDLGNWADSISGRTKVVKLNYKTLDGSAVKVRVLNGWDPMILNPEQKYEIDDRWKGIFYPVYWILKKLHLA